MFASATASPDWMVGPVLVAVVVVEVVGVVLPVDCVVEAVDDPVSNADTGPNGRSGVLDAAGVSERAGVLDASGVLEAAGVVDASDVLDAAMFVPGVLLPMLVFAMAGVLLASGATGDGAVLVLVLAVELVLVAVLALPLSACAAMRP